MYPNDEIDDLIIDELDEIEEEEIEVNDVLIGTVVDCVRLNVRSKPYSSAAVACVIDNNAEVMIDDGESTNEFYKVITASGIEGYCMKKFISIQS